MAAMTDTETMERCPVEVWAPAFLYYSGSHLPKFKEDQVLSQRFALAPAARGGWWCKLCDAQVPAGQQPDKHMREHARELKQWRTRRNRETVREAKARLAEARRERALVRRVLASDDATNGSSDPATEGETMTDETTAEAEATDEQEKPEVETTPAAEERQAKPDPKGGKASGSKGKASSKPKASKPKKETAPKADTSAEIRELYTTLLARAKKEQKATVKTSPKGHYSTLVIDGMSVCYVWAPSSKGCRIEIACTLGDLSEADKKVFKLNSRSDSWAVGMTMAQPGDVDHILSALKVAHKSCVARKAARRSKPKETAGAAS